MAYSTHLHRRFRPFLILLLFIWSVTRLCSGFVTPLIVLAVGLGSGNPFGKERREVKNVLLASPLLARNPNETIKSESRVYLYISNRTHLRKTQFFYPFESRFLRLFRGPYWVWKRLESIGCQMDVQCVLSLGAVKPRQGSGTVLWTC